MNGRIVNGRPMIDVDVEMKGGLSQKISALLDTGFDGELALPNPQFSQLKSIRLKSANTVLAEGSVRKLPRCMTMIRFDGRRQRVVVTDLGLPTSDVPIVPLVGTRLLKGYSIHIDLQVDGMVKVHPIGS